MKIFTKTKCWILRKALENNLFTVMLPLKGKINSLPKKCYNIFSYADHEGLKRYRLEYVAGDKILARPFIKHESTTDSLPETVEIHASDIFKGKLSIHVWAKNTKVEWQEADDNFYLLGNDRQYTSVWDILIYEWLFGRLLHDAWEWFKQKWFNSRFKTIQDLQEVRRSCINVLMSKSPFKADDVMENLYDMSKLKWMKLYRLPDGGYGKTKKKLNMYLTDLVNGEELQRGPNDSFVQGKIFGVYEDIDTKDREYTSTRKLTLLLLIATLISAFASVIEIVHHWDKVILLSDFWLKHQGV